MFDINSITKFWKSNVYLGLDIGAYYLKVVQLEKVDHGFRLLKKNILNIRDLYGTSELNRNIQIFLNKKGYTSSGSVSVNIEHPSLLIRRMDLPKMPARDLATAIKWNFREHVDGSIDDYSVSHTPLVGFESKSKSPVCAFCISHDAVSKMQEMTKDIGLTVTSIEPNATALTAVFSNALQWQRDKYYVLLDLGYSISNFIVIGNGALMFSRPLGNLNGQKLISLVVKEGGIDEAEAERRIDDIISKWNEPKGGGSDEDKVIDGKIWNAVSQFVSQMVIDVQRSIDSFCLMFKKDKIDKLYLCGGGTRLPNIVDRFAKGLGVESEMFNPFTSVLGIDESVYDEYAPMYALAVGLALPWE
jgi:type IV pilus assembly protein PilM